MIEPDPKRVTPIRRRTSPSCCGRWWVPWLHNKCQLHRSIATSFHIQLSRHQLRALDGFLHGRGDTKHWALTKKKRFASKPFGEHDEHRLSSSTSVWAGRVRSCIWAKLFDFVPARLNTMEPVFEIVLTRDSHLPAHLGTYITPMNLSSLRALVIQEAGKIASSYRPAAWF